MNVIPLFVEKIITIGLAGSYYLFCLYVEVMKKGLKKGKTYKGKK